MRQSAAFPPEGQEEQMGWFTKKDPAFEPTYLPGLDATASGWFTSFFGWYEKDQKSVGKPVQWNTYLLVTCLTLANTAVAEWQGSETASAKRGLDEVNGLLSTAGGNITINIPALVNTLGKHLDHSWRDRSAPAVRAQVIDTLKKMN